MLILVVDLFDHDEYSGHQKNTNFKGRHIFTDLKQR